MSRERHKARRRAVQAIYQWQMTDQDIADIGEQFLVEQDMAKVELAYFQELLREVPRHLHELDAHVAPFLDRSMAEVDPVERAILRIGAYELALRPDVPYRVVINEAVELAKIFGAEQSHKYINGVLDKVAHKVRAAEVEARRQGDKAGAAGRGRK